MEKSCLGFAPVNHDTVCNACRIQRITHGAGEMDATDLFILARACPAIDLHNIVVAIGRTAQLVVRLSGYREPGYVRCNRPLWGAARTVNSGMTVAGDAIVLKTGASITTCLRAAA